MCFCMIFLSFFFCSFNVYLRLKYRFLIIASLSEKKTIKRGQISITNRKKKSVLWSPKIYERLVEPFECVIGRNMLVIFLS